MAAGTEGAERTHGFWAGFFAGLVVSALAATALALLNPLPSFPPEVSSGALEAPAAPEAPSAQGILAPAAPGPLTGDAAAPELPPAPAADPFENSPAGSPSLVPGD